MNQLYWLQDDVLEFRESPPFEIEYEIEVESRRTLYSYDPIEDLISEVYDYIVLETASGNDDVSTDITISDKATALNADADEFYVLRHQTTVDVDYVLELFNFTNDLSILTIDLATGSLEDEVPLLIDVGGEIPVSGLDYHTQSGELWAVFQDEIEEFVNGDYNYYFQNSIGTVNPETGDVDILASIPGDDETVLTELTLDVQNNLAYVGGAADSSSVFVATVDLTDGSTNVVDLDISVDSELPLYGLDFNPATGNLYGIFQTDTNNGVDFEIGLVEPNTGQVDVIQSYFFESGDQENDEGSPDFAALDPSTGIYSIGNFEDSGDFVLSDWDVASGDYRGDASFSSSIDTFTPLLGVEVGQAFDRTVVQISGSPTALIESEETELELAFSVAGEIPADGLLVFVDGGAVGLADQFADLDPADLNNIGDVEASDDGSGFSVLLLDNEASFKIKVLNDGIDEADSAITLLVLDGETYQADPTANSFEFSLSDEISTPNSAPTAQNDTVSVDEDQTLVIDVAANDSDVDDNLVPSSVVIDTPPTHGALINNGDGTVSYTPNHNVSGSDSFSYSIADEDDLTSGATVDLTINPVNDAPSVQSFTLVGQVGTAQSFLASQFSQSFQDLEGAPLAQIQIVSLPDNATLSLDGSPVALNQMIDVTDLDSLSIEPSPGLDGRLSFEWLGSDGTDFSDSSALARVRVFNPIGGDDQDNTLSGTLATDYVKSGNGDDVISGDGGNDILLGGGGNDVMLGGDDNDFLRGEAGADNLDGGEGFDALDYLNSNAGVTINLDGNTASGGHAEGDVIANFERVNGSRFDDQLTGDNENNRLVGRQGNDVLQGLAGDDSLRGGAGDDEIDGGDGTGDRFQEIADVDFVAADGSLTGFGNDTFSNIEILQLFGGGSGNTQDATSLTETRAFLYGRGGDDQLIGGAAHDRLQGDDGNDTLAGNAGDDLLRGGYGDDVFDGGDGLRDRIQESADVDFSTQGDTVLIGLGTDTFAQIEILHLIGGESNNIQDASSLSTVRAFLSGEGGNDTLTGGSSNDRLFGGQGADELIGLGGNDRIDLGELDGSTDVIQYQRGDGKDTVLNFEQGTGGDRLDFANIAEIDVVVLGTQTQFRLADESFGAGELLLTVQDVNTFSTSDEGVNFTGATFKFA